MTNILWWCRPMLVFAETQTEDNASFEHPKKQFCEICFDFDMRKQQFRWFFGVKLLAMWTGLFAYFCYNSTTCNNSICEGLCTGRPHTSLFSCTVRTLNDITPNWLKAQVSARARHVTSMAIHVVRLIDRLFSLCSSLCSFPCVSPIPCSSLPTSTCTLSWTFLPCGKLRGKQPLPLR